MNFNMASLEIRENGGFRILGRKNIVDGVPRFSWSNSGVEFCAKCDRLTVHFGEYNAEQPVYFKIYVDSVEIKACVIGKSVTAVVENLRDRIHKIKIIRISEGSTTAYIDKIEICGKSPEFSMPADTKKLKLEFLGDSITSGYGVLAAKSRTAYYTYEQDSTKSYAYLTAQALGADIRTECISGQGIVHSSGENVGIKFVDIFDMIARRKPGYKCDGYIPDVFIINGGTNDKLSHVTPDEFVNGALELLTAIRKMYPSTPIIWMYGAMVHVFDESIVKAVHQFNKHDKNTYCLIVKSIYDYKNQTGAAGHPNVNGSIRCAGILKRKIAEILSFQK